MECVNLEYSRRPLSLELLVEMHKCLPLADAINVLVNVPSFAFVDINKPRMLRTIQQLKKSLNEYIGTLVYKKDEDESTSDESDMEEARNDPEKLIIRKIIEWKPELDALFRYGSWLTSKRQFWMNWYSNNRIVGMSTNFMEELLLHLSNSRSPQTMLQSVQLIFAEANLPIPTFINQLLFNEKKQYGIGARIFFGSVELKMDDNGRILPILDGKLSFLWLRWNYELTLFVTNKMDRKNLFKITMHLDNSKEFIRQLGFSQWKMESFNDIANFVKESRSGDVRIKQNGNKLKMKSDIDCNANLDMFLRHGTSFTKFRHFKVKKPYNFVCRMDMEYADFLIEYISNTKHPENFLESIDMDLGSYLEDDYSPIILKIWEYFHKGIGESFPNEKLHILSARTTKSKKTWTENSSDGPKMTIEYSLEFTLANIPTNGEYLFDVELQSKNGCNRIDGIKIQKRKVEEIVEMNCNEQIEKKQLGKKRKAENDDDEEEDGPICSSKIMKK